jgi:hypothetical protein
MVNQLINGISEVGHLALTDDHNAITARPKYRNYPGRGTANE